MRKVIIMRGISGAGKSTYIQEHFSTAKIVSADRYFTNKATGEYRFNPAELNEAHAYCFRHFLNELGHSERIIVVDNTNISAFEVSPYVLAANAFGYEHEIITLLVDPSLAFLRNIHDVPDTVVSGMSTRLVDAVLPNWWNTKDVQ